MYIRREVDFKYNKIIIKRTTVNAILIVLTPLR